MIIIDRCPTDSVISVPKVAFDQPSSAAKILMSTGEISVFFKLSREQPARDLAKSLKHRAWPPLSGYGDASPASRKPSPLPLSDY